MTPATTLEFTRRDTTAKVNNRAEETPPRAVTAATHALLRAAATVTPDPARIDRIGELALEIPDWQHVATTAEEHNLAPLLHRHLASSGIDPSARRLLGALAIRHRHANATLTAVLEEILGLFEHHAIDCIVLKGMALSHLVYPEVALRPMRDIDLLLPRHQADRGQQLLAELGFSLAQHHEHAMGGGRFMRNHHHLPIASLERDGMTVSVEIHTDALSGDYPESLAYDIVDADTQSWRIGERTARAMGHAHMLTHLCRHALEPGAETRLGSVTDIVSYAHHFRDEIDWDALARDHGYALNALRMLHYVSPLDASLSHLVPEQPSPPAAGFGMRPLGAILGGDAGLLTKLRELMHPPVWWLYAYYGADPGAPVRLVRWTHHFPRVVRWLARRLRAAVAK